jgi:hypothetical protein
MPTQIRPIPAAKARLSNSSSLADGFAPGVRPVLAQFEFQHAYLDEVEYSLHCSNRFCRGGVRISLIHDDKNEGFVGGMA